MPSPEANLSPTEEETGVGIDRASIREIRAHCVMDWDDVLTVKPCGTFWEFSMVRDNGMQIDAGRMRAFAYALLEAVDA